MKYALLIYGDDSEWIDLPPEERSRLRQEELPRWYGLFEEVQRVDPEATGKELTGRAQAKVVTVRGGEEFVTDGPYVETKEYLGGVMLVDVPDLDEAIRLASLVPAAETGSIEIRPLLR